MESRALKSVAALFDIYNNGIVESSIFSNVVGLTNQRENPELWNQMFPNYEVWKNQFYQVQSKSESISIKYYKTLGECKKWFENYCNIPSNWVVIAPDGESLDGKYYQNW